MKRLRAFLPIIVRVKQAHIDAGIVGDCGYCPIALALLDKYAAASVSVGILSFRVNDRTFSTPFKGRRFIGAFDTFQPVKPFTFVAWPGSYSK